MRTLTIVVGFIIALLAIHYSQPVEHKGKVCHDLEYVDVTHRDGFWYCHTDSTVLWVKNFQTQEWQSASQFEKRRVK